MADGTLVNALLPGNLAVALAEDQMCLYPDSIPSSQSREYCALLRVVRR